MSGSERTSSCIDSELLPFLNKHPWTSLDHCPGGCVFHTSQRTREEKRAVVMAFQCFFLFLDDMLHVKNNQQNPSPKKQSNMIQRNSSNVSFLIGSLSHLVTGFFYIPGGANVGHQIACGAGVETTGDDAAGVGAVPYCHGS